MHDRLSDTLASQVHPPHRGRVVRVRLHELQRQTSLAEPAGADECELRRLGEQAGNCRELLFAAEEARERRRQVATAGRARDCRSNDSASKK